MKTQAFLETFEFEQLCENVRAAHEPFEDANRDTIEREAVEFICDTFGSVAGFDIPAIVERLSFEVY